MVKAYIWDLDGTIFKNEPIHEAATAEIAEQNLPDFDADTFKRVWTENLGKGVPVVYDALCEVYPELYENISKEAFVEAYKEAYIKKIQATKPEDFVREGSAIAVSIVQALGKPLGSVTNGLDRLARATIAAAGMTQAFGDNLYAYDSLPEGAKPKPEPHGYWHMMEKLGVNSELEADQVVIFEDSPSGVKAAVASGAIVVQIVEDASEINENVDYVIYVGKDAHAFSHPYAISYSELHVAMNSDTLVKRNFGGGAPGIRPAVNMTTELAAPHDGMAFTHK